MLQLVARSLSVGFIVTGVLALAAAQRVGLRRLFWLLMPSRRGQPYAPLTAAALLRITFERLGPTFVKFGQIIASSPGLFPRNLSREFERCLDRVPPFAFDEVQAIVQRELGDARRDRFAEFDPEPLAAASIAQVHAARLRSGEPVVVKIQRPRIAGRVDSDLVFLAWGARTLQRLSVRARLMNLVGIVDDFGVTIRQELDFRTEAANMDEFNAIMERHGIGDVVAPRPHHDLTTTRVLTMERFFGFKADDIEQARALDVDSEYYLRAGLRAWNLGLMLYGYFHGDVHAGNLMFLPKDKKVGFLDFGIIGRFDDAERRQVMRYVLAFSTMDFHEVASILVEMGSVASDVDIDAFAKALQEVYAPVFGSSLGEIHYEAMLPRIAETAMRFGVHLPRAFVLILKQLLFFDRYAKLAAPHLNVFTDLYLVDFLFGDDPAKAGVDLSEVLTAMAAIQQRLAKRRREERRAARAAARAEDS